ncbi:MAG: site-specific integrase [Candidatus Acidiferrum sp.]
MHLTEKFIAQLKPGKKREQYPDDNTTGFGLRNDPSGRKSFYWLAKVKGKPRFRALGESPTTSVADARAAAQELSGQAAAWKRAGYPSPDPFSKAPPEKPTSAPLFSELLEHYIQRKVHDPKHGANHPDRAEKDLRWLVGKYCPELLARPIDAITTQDIVAIHNGLSETPYIGNRTVQTIKTLFNWAKKSRNGKINFWVNSDGKLDNPAVSIEMYDEAERERYIKPEEFSRFKEALASTETPTDLRDFIELSLETAARKASIWAMKWDDISGEDWTVPAEDSKSGEAYTVELSEKALLILERRKEAAKLMSPFSGFVFPCDSNPSGHVAWEFERAWIRFRKRCGLEDLRIHDVRRSAGSYMAMAGKSAEEIAAALGQTSTASTDVYMRHHPAAKRATREAGRKKMDEMEQDYLRKQEKKVPLQMPISR